MYCTCIDLRMEYMKSQNEPVAVCCSVLQCESDWPLGLILKRKYYMCVCIHTCTHIYICIHTHTHV